MGRLEKRFERNPSLKPRFEQQRDEFNQALRQRIERNAGLQSPAAIYTIPVVFHIVTTNPSQITDAQIQDQLNVLNADFAGLNADSTGIPVYFKSLFGKSGIRFCLAQRKPSGEATTGIERTTTTESSFSYLNDLMKYAVSGGADSWDPTKYFNVWICPLTGGVLGYATFPEDGQPEAQGVVIDYRSLPGGSYTVYNGGKTLTHETGHYFNLYHIWGDDNGACSGTDYVDDTPNQAGSTNGCYSGVHTDGCTTGGNGIMYQNYMDYSYDNCMMMFTTQQVTRMEAALQAYRSSLFSSDGCTPVVAYQYDAKLVSIDQPAQKICASGISPVVTIKNNGLQTLTSLSITFRLDNEALQTQSWTGSLAPYATTTVNLTSLTIAEGSHRLQVYTRLPNQQADELPANDTAAKTFIYSAPVDNISEGFESNTFAPGNWDVVNPDGGTTWQRYPGISRSGSAAAGMDNFNYSAIGQHDDLRLPLIRIDSKDSAFLSFYVAAAAYTSLSAVGNNWDTLEVLLSRDCGNSYTSLYKRYGSVLVTRSSPLTTAFSPASSEWRKDSINLSQYIDAGDLLIAFRNTTGNENNLFLDDIRLRTVVVNPNLKTKGFLVTPSPTTGSIQVQFYPQPEKLTAIQVLTSTGQQLALTRIPTGQANNTYTYDLSGFAAGMYIVKAIFTDRVEVKKIIKN